MRIRIPVQFLESGKTIALEAKPRKTVRDLKALIFKQEGIPIDKQNVLLGENLLKDTQKISQFQQEIQNG